MYKKHSRRRVHVVRKLSGAVTSTLPLNGHLRWSMRDSSPRSPSVLTSDSRLRKIEREVQDLQASINASDMDGRPSGDESMSPENPSENPSSGIQALEDSLAHLVTELRSEPNATKARVIDGIELSSVIVADLLEE
jgi:hypothetical protein